MKGPRIVVVGIVLLLLPLLTFGAHGETAEGRITETGWGSFRIEDADGVIRQFNQSGKITSYQPAGWRPREGDRVSLQYTVVMRRSDQILRVDTMTLLSPGPNTTILESPLVIRITETGRTGIRGVIVADDPDDKINNLEVRFAHSRQSRYLPPGWVPVVGEYARVDFAPQPDITGFGVGMVIGQIARIEPSVRETD